MTQENIDIAWLSATLADAAEALNDAVSRLDAEGLSALDDLLNRDLVHVYAKLNYAVNTAEAGEAALETMSEDALVAWPEGMPFARAEELADDEGGEN